MALKVGAVFGEAVLKTAKWTSGATLIQKGAKKLGGVLATAAKVGFVALSAAIIKSTFEANKFQKAFSNVTTLIDSSDENFQEISKSLLKLDSRLGTSAELTQGLYQAISAGAEDAAAGLVIVEQAAKFSTAALTDNSTAVDVLTTAMNAYGSDVVNAAQASDIFFKTIEKGKINGEQLASTIGQSIPLFASTGIALEELTSGMAAMTKQGVSASESTTQLNAIVNSFLKPSENLSAALQDMGFESGAAFLKTEGLAGALKLLQDETKGDATALAELLPNIRAMRGAMALTGVGGEEFTAILKEMETATGATEIAFQKQEVTFQTFRNELNKSQVLIGNVSKFFVDKLAVGATQALEAVNKFLLSTKGMEAFAKAASFVGSVFGIIEEAATIISETVAPALKEAIDDITEEFSSLFDEISEGPSAIDIFSAAIQIASKVLIVAIKIIKLYLNVYIDLFKIIIEGGKIIANFYRALSGKGTWDEFKAAVAGGGDAVLNMVKNIKKNGIDIGIALKGVGGEIVDVFSNVDESTAKTSKRISDNLKKRSEEAKNFVVKNYDEMVTGVNASNAKLETEADKTGEIVKTPIVKAIETSKTALEQFNAWVDTNLKTFADKFTFAFNVISEAASMAFQGIGDISAQFYTNEFAKLDNANAEEKEALDTKHATELESLQQQLDSSLITEEEFNTKKQILDTKAATEQEALRKDQLSKENKLKKEQFETNKKLSIANVWMNLASAVMGFWAAYAAIPIAGPIIAGSLSAAALGIAIAQTALISQQQFVPARKDGGAASGLTQVNEEGGELITLPDGSVVVPNDISKDIAAASGGNSTIVNVNNPIVREESDIQKIANAVDSILARRAQFA